MEWKFENNDIDNHDYSQDIKWKLRVNGVRLPEIKVDGYPIRYLKYRGQTYFIDSGDVLAPITLRNLHNILSLPNLIGFEDEE